MVETPLPALLADGRGAAPALDRAAFLAHGREACARTRPPRPSHALPGTSEHPTAADLTSRRSRTSSRSGPSVRRGDQKLVTFPAGAAPPRGRETPPYARAAVFASMDTPGPLRGGRRRRATTTSRPSSRTGPPEHRRRPPAHVQPLAIDGDHRRPRGLPRALPAVPLHATSGQQQGAQAHVHDDERRGLGPLRRADDGGRRLRRRRSTRGSSDVDKWAAFSRRCASRSCRRRCCAIAATSSAPSRCTRRAWRRSTRRRGSSSSAGFQEQANGHEEALRGSTYDPMLPGVHAGQAADPGAARQIPPRARGTTCARSTTRSSRRARLPVAFIEKLILTTYVTLTTRAALMHPAARFRT